MSASDATGAFEIALRYIQEWKQTLSMTRWRVEVERDDNFDGYAACVAWPAYRKARLTINADLMHEHLFDDLSIESTVVHELVHALLWIAFNQLANTKLPADLLSHHEEETTEVITHALLQAKYAGDKRVDELWSATRVVRSFEADAETDTDADERVGDVAFERTV